MMDSTKDDTVVEVHKSKPIEKQVRAGLAVAGVGFSMLTTVFGLFHVNTFLKVYRLDPQVFSGGSVIFSIVNAANDVGGAWMVDQLALKYKRSDLVGLTGCLFALCAVTPFFRPQWMMSSGWFSSGLHFVVTLSLYDTLYSFAMILTGSIISDDSNMTQKLRIRFSIVCKVANMVASFVVARAGLFYFDAEAMLSFQRFIVALALVVVLLSLIAQAMIHSSKLWSLRGLLLPRMTATSCSKRNLEVRQVIRDFQSHNNFWMWIGMELLLESQNTFNVNFRKIFMDELVVGNGFDKSFCDWIISLMRPLATVCTLLVFIPIQRFGYPRVYTSLFLFNFSLSTLMLSCADQSSSTLVLVFLVLYPVAVSSVLSAGFSLAMADMLLEMKHKHAKHGRFDEPSLAGLFMGANALFCKPSEALLPILGAKALDRGDDNSMLFRVLILPPLLFSVLQLLSWRNYNLDAARVEMLRAELKAAITEGRPDEDRTRSV